MLLHDADSDCSLITEQRHWPATAQRPAATEISVGKRKLCSASLSDILLLTSLSSLVLLP